MMSAIAVPYSLQMLSLQNPELDWRCNSSVRIAGNHSDPAVVVNRSTDGGLTWNDPVNVSPDVASSDKNWIVCDSQSSSPFYGNC